MTGWNPAPRGLLIGAGLLLLQAFLTPAEAKDKAEAPEPATAEAKC